MKKLVELDAALDGVANILDYEIAKGYSGSISRKGVMDMLTTLPTVDAVPVRHGHWVKWYEAVYDSFGVGYAPHYKCSECDTEYDQYDAMRMNYCSNCGAKLIEDIDEKRRTG